jgi:hypothetical protein
MKKFAVAAALLAAGAPSWAAVKASRPAQKGCAWAALADAGVELSYQKCNWGYRTVDFVSASTEAVVYEVIHDTKGKNPDAWEPVIRLFTKEADETPEAALKRLFYGALSAEQKKRCVVTREKISFKDKNKTAYSISPDAAFDAEIRKKAEGDIPEPPCGEMGMDYDSQSYFEFHRGATRFAHVSFGQEEHPDFDEESLVYLPAKSNSRP